MEVDGKDNDDDTSYEAQFRGRNLKGACVSLVVLDRIGLDVSSRLERGVNTPRPLITPGSLNLCTEHNPFLDPHGRRQGRRAARHGGLRGARVDAAPRARRRRALRRRQPVRSQSSIAL